MSNFNFAAGDKIAQAIDKRIITIAKQVANKSTVNRTVFGRVIAKNNGLFSLRINNTVYTNVIALKNSNYINVGDKVVCLVPNNQFNDLLILGVADGSLLATSEYTLNQASSTELGGIKANNRTVEDQEVRIDPNTGFLYYSLGKSIESIEKTSTSGLVDTYTITYTDGTYTTFTITNADQIDIQYTDGQLQWKYASETTWTTLFTVDNSLSTTSTNPIQNQAVTNALNGKANLTGENTFTGGQTIQGNIYVGGKVNIPNGPVTVQNINVVESISSLQNNVSSINNNINTDVVQNINTNINGDNFSLIQTLINLNTQATTQQSINIPLANASTAGLMSSSDFSSLQNLEDRVGNLEGKTTRLLYTASTNPTASDINSFVTGLGYTSPFEGIAVVVDETFHIWHYYDNNSIGWRDDGVDTVSNFTNTTAGIILGSTDNGKVFAETDGTGSVNGWDTLNTNVSNLQSTTQTLSSSVSTLQNTVSTHTSNISDLQTTTQSLSNSINNLNTQVETNTTNITNLQNSKININQGTANTGKVLTVGGDGNVSPQDIPSSSGTVVNIGNVPQSEINFTSDPQTQLDNLSNIGIAITITDEMLISPTTGILPDEEYQILIKNNSNTLILNENNISIVLSLQGDDVDGTNTLCYVSINGINKIKRILIGKPIISSSIGEGHSFTIQNLTYSPEDVWKQLYPIGSIFISINNTSPASFLGGSWLELPEGYTLFTTTTSGQGNEIISAGLPNIIGNISGFAIGSQFDSMPPTGAFIGSSKISTGVNTWGSSDANRAQINFDANQSNSIYGNSTTVQPPAIKVYMWRRVS